MKLIGHVLAVVLLGATGPALAQDNPAVPTAEDQANFQQCLEGAREAGGSKETCVGTVSSPCLEAPDNQSTPMMGACAEKELVLWDGLLNDHYAALKERISGEQAAELRDAQRAWIAMRDQSCGFEASLWGGGTGAGPAAILCHMRETGHRAVFLGDLLDFVAQ